MSEISLQKPVCDEALLSYYSIKDAACSYFFPLTRDVQNFLYQQALQEWFLLREKLKTRGLIP